MKMLKVIALLLHYPDQIAAEGARDMIAVIESDKRLTKQTRAGLAGFIQTQRQADLLDQQADYVALFDRGRALSLYLFEHVHGESRDRGQAMVELLAAYQEKGLCIDASELPDYIPLFLEFCSLLPESEARDWLKQVEHLLQALQLRLEMRNSPYALLFKALFEWGGLHEADKAMREAICAEKRDDTPQALDRVWSETPVLFGPANGCQQASGQQGQAVPIDTSALRHRQPGGDLP